MNIFNKLGYDLQEVILKKIYQSDTKYAHNKLLLEFKEFTDNWKTTRDNMYYNYDLTFYRFLFKEQIGLCGDKCNYCSTSGTWRAFYEFFSEFPYYEKKLIDNNTYKNKKTYKKQYYYMNTNIRSSYSYNYLCYACYFGYSKKPCKLFIPI